MEDLEKKVIQCETKNPNDADGIYADAITIIIERMRRATSSESIGLSKELRKWYSMRFNHQ